MKGPRSLLLVVLCLALAGCTLGPDPERPATAADAAESFVHADPAAAPPTEVSPWWTTFGDTTTSELVEQALENNTDLQVAAARLLEAEANYRKSRGSLTPQVDYSLSGSRTKTSFVLPEMGRRTIYSTTFSDSLSVSYQVDLFGKLKRTRQSAWAGLLAEEASHEAMVHSVIASVVRARVQIATAARALEVAREVRTSWENTLETVERRYRSGLVGAVDLHLARENLAANMAVEEELEASLELAHIALDVLLGRRPGSGAHLPDSLPDLPDLGLVPVGLPAALLDRRPDLRRTEMQLAASTFGVGAAMADLYPSLSLTASGGSTSDSLSDLLDVDSIVYNAVANLVGPIFAGGSRRAEVEAAKARAEAAAATYAGTVLNALREVENALVADAANRRRLTHTRRQLAEAQSADGLARERYQRGVESFLRMLETERRLRNAEQAMISVRSDLWNTRIDLFLALGGDWTPDEAKPNPPSNHAAVTPTTDPTTPTRTEVSP